MSEPAYVSLTAWLTPATLSEQVRDGRTPTATLHVMIPHGKSRRAVPIEVTLDQCLALCANAADAARLLAPYRTDVARSRTAAEEGWTTDEDRRPG